MSPINLKQFKSQYKLDITSLTEKLNKILEIDRLTSIVYEDILSNLRGTDRQDIGYLEKTKLIFHSVVKQLGFYLTELPELDWKDSKIKEINYSLAVNDGTNEKIYNYLAVFQPCSDFVDLILIRHEGNDKPKAYGSYITHFHVQFPEFLTYKEGDKDRVDEDRLLLNKIIKSMLEHLEKLWVNVKANRITPESSERSTPDDAEIDGWMNTEILQNELCSNYHDSS